MVATGPGNTRLKSARQGMGLRSQQALADAVTRTARGIGLRVSVTARTVRRWESDAPPWPNPDHQAALESLFQRPIVELGFVPPWAEDSAVVPSADDPGEHTAPGFIAAYSGTTLTAFPSRSVLATLPASAASDYIAITSSHRRLYYTVSAMRLHKPVAAHANLGTSLLFAVPEAARTSLATAVAESSMLAGRMEFFDLQRPEAAQESFVIALQAAQDAGDPIIGAAVLAHMALIPAFSGSSKRAEEARDKVRAARVFARRGPASPEMLAWLDAVEAEIETRFGNTRKALRLISHAEDVMATAERRPSPPWLDWFSAERLAGFKGNTLLADQQHSAARHVLEQALADDTDRESKQRAVTFADLAAVAVAEEDPDRACELASAALDNLARYWYATGMDRVRSVRQTLTRWESRPSVRRLDDRLYDWNMTINAMSG